jgi:hypothetical protein
MGCGGSSEASGKAYGVDTVGILGVQGAGKSTVMKQFRNDGNFELAPAQARAIKDGAPYDLLPMFSFVRFPSYLLLSII